MQEHAQIKPLLGADEPSPVTVSRPHGTSQFVLICEHASKRLPAALGDLGLSAEVLSGHIGWDIGALAVAERLSTLLDATLIAQRYSRLAYDCNRPPESPSAIPERSEIFDVPGNHGLDAIERAARTEALYHPFQDAIGTVLDLRRDEGRAPVVVTVHSFTALYFGRAREVELGVLHDTDSRYADHLLDAFTPADHRTYRIRRNAPYGPEDGVTHTLRLQALTRGLANVMIEIGNGLIDTAEGQNRLAALLAARLASALQELRAEDPSRNEGARNA